jgi:tetratricopeptide (TPR) repeat protein
MANLGMSYINQGRYDDAIQLEKTVCDLAKTVYGDRYSDITLTAMNNLALAYTYQGLWNDAVGLQETVLEARRRALGPSHKETLTALENLRFTYSSMGQLEKASEL